MRLIWTLLAGLLLCVPAARGADDAKDKKVGDKQPASAREALVAVESALRSDASPLLQKFRETKSDAEKKKIRDQFVELQASYAGKYLAIAERFPKDAEAIDALVQAVAAGRGNTDSEKAVVLLGTRFADHVRIGEVCLQLATSDAPGVEKLLRAVFQKNTKKDTQGTATLALAQYLKKRSADAYAKNKEQSARLAVESEKTYEEVLSKFADVKAEQETLGEMAKGELFDLRFLAIGKTAFEIEGEDLDGKKFKLSDYRGKVVMLDFWGHW